MYSIVVVGAGATGSNITTFLSQLALSEKKIKEIILIDGDLVESKNFANQKFTKNDIGKNKARVLANRFSKLGIKISYIDKYIERPNELVDIIKSLKGEVILVGSVDNNQARKYMNLTFYNDEIANLIYIDTGNGDKDRWGQTVLGYKKNFKEVHAPVSTYFPQILDEEEPVTETINYSCSQIQEHPQNLAVNIMSATTVFLMITNLISFGKMDTLFARFNADKVEVISK